MIGAPASHLPYHSIPVRSLDTHCSLHVTEERNLSRCWRRHLLLGPLNRRLALKKHSSSSSRLQRDETKQRHYFCYLQHRSLMDTNDRPHECTFCDRRFRKSEHLTRHTRTRKCMYACAIRSKQPCGADLPSCRHKRKALSMSLWIFFC